MVHDWRPDLRIPALWALVALLGAGSGVAGQEPPSIGLDEAVERALLLHPDAIASEGVLDNAEATLLQAKGAFLPNLTVNSSYANSSNQRFDQSTGRLVSESYSAQTLFSYDLFTGGRKLAEYRSAGAQVRAAEASRRAQRFVTILETKSAYFEAEAASRLLDVARQRLARAAQQQEFASTRLEVGTATRSDVLRAELELANAELAVVDAETALRTARLALGRQVGLEQEVQPADSTLPARAPELPEGAALEAMAVSASPMAVSARAAYDESRAHRYASVTGYIPTLRATGGLDWFSFEWPPQDRSWNLRLVASLPLFNGLQREAGLARANATLRTAEARARDAEIGARLVARDAAARIGSAERRVEISDRAVELAREDLRVQEDRYQFGAATILELLTSQVALSDAEVAQVRARQQLGVAVAELEAVLGQDISAR